MNESLRPGHPPFRSLDFFTGADAAVFAGREEEIEEVATRILAGDTLVVYGPSGVGKTSLLCAGVVPALEHRRGYRVTYVRPLQSPRGDIWRAVGADPAEPLATALARLPALQPPEAAISVGRSPELLEARAWAIDDQGPTACAPHVLVLDQLEELFTRFDESQRRPLWDGLVEVIEDGRAPVRLVLSLREEYLHFLDSAHPRLPNLLDRRFRLRGLAPFGARTAIVRPLVAGRIRYEPELVDRCVADLTEVPAGHSDEDGVVDPLLLQIVCSEVYRPAEQRDPEMPSLTLADYTELGGPAGVFRRHLNELFNRVRIDDHLLLKLVLQEMTTAHATKLPTTISRLSQSGLLAPAVEIQGLLDKLVAVSLVRKYEAEPEPWYELVHDRLVQALPEQFALDHQFLRIRFMREVVRQLSKGFSEGMIGAPLLNRQQLADLVEPFRKYIRFSELEVSLLFRSAVATEHNVLAWRDTFEAVAPGGAPAVLLDMLSHTETRRGAVASVGVLGMTEPALRAHCLRLALHDTDHLVATAAAKALNAVAGAEEVVALALALKDQAARPRALWVLEELTEHAAFQATISARDLRRARRAHERGQFVIDWETIQRGGLEGAKIGIGTGALSGLGAMVFWCIALTWLGCDDVVPYAAGAGVIAVVSMILGSVCGHAAGRAMAKLRALGRSPTWILAIRDRSALGTLTIAFVLVIFVVPFLLVAVGEPLAIPKPDSDVLSALAVAALFLPALAIILYTIGLTEWTLPQARWHRTRTPVFLAIRAFLLSWLFAIVIGAILVFFCGEQEQDVNIIMIGTVLGGAWCSICATAIAVALADSMWRLSRSRRVLPRRWLGRAPAAAFLATVIVLLWRMPLPFWAPVIDVTNDRATHLEPAPPRDLAKSWMYGRWLRIRNRSSDVRVISFTMPDIHLDGTSRLPFVLVWPGTHTQWFSSDVIKLYLRYRQIDLAHDVPLPGTYAVVKLEDAHSSYWTKTLSLGVRANHILARRIGCHIFHSDSTETCYSYDHRMTDCQLDSALATELRWKESQMNVSVSCDADDSSEQIQRIEAIVIFDSQ